MKTLYLDGQFGASGDMLIGSLLSHVDRVAFLGRLAGFAKANGYTLESQEESRSGILGYQIHVITKKVVQARRLDGIIKTIQQSDLNDRVKSHAIAVFQRLGEAEAAVHGVSLQEVHFHEVGGIDCLADIVTACALMDEIAPERVVVSPLNVGHGRVACAHGVLPVPAPAVVQLLSGVPVTCVGEPGERVTPTGAALITHFATAYGQMPGGSIQSAGCGFGERTYCEGNYLRSFLMEQQPNKQALSADWVYALTCTIDDMTAESLAFACEQLMKAGALDVYQQPVMMKKGRMGTLVTLLCVEEEKFCRLIFAYTSTLGVRVQHIRRALRGSPSFETIDTQYGAIRLKHTGDMTKPEYDDIRKAAASAGISFDDMLKKVWEEKNGR